MKRLKNKLLCMEPGTVTYRAMYEGSVLAYDPSRPNLPPCEMSDPVYYDGNIGFLPTVTNKTAQDKPTFTVIIPAREIINGIDEIDEKEGMFLKRLKHYLMHMENDTATYREMYDGEVSAIPANYPQQLDYKDKYNTFYDGDVSFDITQTNKLAQDVPTLTYHIPADIIGCTDPTSAAADYCLRALAPYIDALNADLYNRSRPDNENGMYYLYRPGGEVLVRNTAYFALCPQKDYENGSGNVVYLLDDGVPRPPVMCLCIRMQVQLPKKKLRKTIQMLCRDLPGAIRHFIEEFDASSLGRALELAGKQRKIREWLATSDCCAFIANGSILPRSKGTDLPMENAVPFTSAPDDEIEVCGVRGMGFRRGVTVVTGGGYSGKSTLLDAVASGVYDHAAGDGRELCLTDTTAMTVCAEDGRSVKCVNISPFIKWLPGGDTHNFSTERASGSTSEAANIMEAVDSGSRLLLIDEDRSATNFMIRDRMMKELIEKEPITPFTDRVGELFSVRGVSTMLVIGGSGEYLAVADRVYMMDDFIISDVTRRAREICITHRSTKSNTDGGTPDLSHAVAQSPTPTPLIAPAYSVPPAVWEQRRTLLADGFTSYPEGSGSERLEVSRMGYIIIGDEGVDIRGLHGLVSAAQSDALAFMLRQLEIRNADATVDLDVAVDRLYAQIAEEGLDSVYTGYFTTTGRFLDLPRRIELKALINRMRRITVRNDGVPVGIANALRT